MEAAIGCHDSLGQYIGICQQDLRKPSQKPVCIAKVLFRGSKYLLRMDLDPF